MIKKLDYEQLVGMARLEIRHRPGKREGAVIEDVSKRMAAIIIELDEALQEANVLGSVLIEPDPEPATDGDGK